MNNLLSGVSITLSVVALAVSGWTASQISQLNASIAQQQDSITEQQNTIEQQENNITRLTKEIAENRTQLSSQPAQQADSTSTSQANNNSIEPGQFVSQGYDNRVKIELLSVKRIQNPDGGNRNIVVVQLRIRRIVPKGKVASVSIQQSKGRNPETSEVYRTITNRSTTYTTINDLPRDSWGNAYFWLEVPEGVNVIDIIIPETAIFNNVPISG